MGCFEWWWDLLGDVSFRLVFWGSVFGVVGVCVCVVVWWGCIGVVWVVLLGGALQFFVSRAGWSLELVVSGTGLLSYAVSCVFGRSDWDLRGS